MICMYIVNEIARASNIIIPSIDTVLYNALSIGRMGINNFVKKILQVVITSNIEVDKDSLIRIHQLSCWFRLWTSYICVFILMLV